MSDNTAWGYGLATIHTDGRTLDTWYPSPRLGAPGEDEAASAGLRRLEGGDEVRRVDLRVVKTVVDLDAAPADPADAYLRLHLLSHRLVKPNTINLDGLFGVLENVVWTNLGPCAVDGFEATRLRARQASAGQVHVLGVDKFPRMVDYVVPSGVRIADGNNVRLGATWRRGRRSCTPASSTSTPARSATP